MISPVRKPYVAGSFYPAERETLLEFFDTHLQLIHPLKRAKAIIVPHAGYIYSGAAAAEVVRRVEIPDLCFLMGPNHYGYGDPFALYKEGGWESPLGAVEVDRNFAAGLLESCHDVHSDFEAHEKEHSLEVEVPFLQYRNHKVKIVPIIIGTLDVEWARRVAESLSEFLVSQSSFLMVASTDMSHYESDSATRKKDRYALEAIEALDEEALAKAVEDHRITMCGFIPVFMTLIIAKTCGARKATLIDYRTSADASGDYDRVVGYAGFIIE